MKNKLLTTLILTSQLLAPNTSISATFKPHKTPKEISITQTGLENKEFDTLFKKNCKPKNLILHKNQNGKEGGKVSKHAKIHPSAYIGHNSIICGAVQIGKNVIIRGDTEIYNDKPSATIISGNVIIYDSNIYNSELSGFGYYNNEDLIYNRKKSYTLLETLEKLGANKENLYDTNDNSLLLVTSYFQNYLQINDWFYTHPKAKITQDNFCKLSIEYISNFKVETQYDPFDELETQEIARYEYRHVKKTIDFNDRDINFKIKLNEINDLRHELNVSQDVEKNSHIPESKETGNILDNLEQLLKTQTALCKIMDPLLEAGITK